MALTAFCLFLPEMNLSRSLRLAAGPPNPDLCAVDDSDRPGRAEVVDDLGQGSQPHVGADSAPALGEQGPHLVDGPGDGGAVHAEPAGQHIVGNPVTKVDQGGQQAVDEHQAVFRTAAHGPLPRSGSKPGLVTLMPQRPDLRDEFSNHSARQARDPPVADDRCSSRVPHHPTMINHHGLDNSPLNVHELVSEPP